MLIRRGSSLAELLVALVLAGVVLAVATTSLLRQQRTATALTGRAQSGAQGRAGGAVLVASLALMAATPDDIAGGEARDTSLQFRAVIATGLACDSSAQVSFTTTDSTGSVIGLATAPRGGDTLWWLIPDSARWRGRPLAEARPDVARCEADERDGAPPIGRRVLRLRTVGGDSVPMFAPMRLTRTQRIDLYRAGDGSWQLGIREWSDVTHALVAPQPAAGPFQLFAVDGARTGFRYFSATGAELDAGDVALTTSRIARIRLTTLAATTAPAAAGSPPVTRDSVDVVLRGDTPP